MTSCSEDSNQFTRRVDLSSDLNRKMILRTRLLKLDPDRSYSYLRWALELLKKKQYSKAKKKFKRAIQISPDLSHLYHEWLNTLYFAREFEEVIFLVERYIEKFSNALVAQNTMGVCYLHLGDFENAIKSFQKVTLMKDDYHMAYFNWALALYLQGKQEEAVEMYEKAKTICEFPDGVYQREIASLKDDLKREENKMFQDLLTMKIEAFDYFIATDRCENGVKTRIY